MAVERYYKNTYNFDQITDSQCELCRYDISTHAWVDLGDSGDVVWCEIAANGWSYEEIAALFNSQAG